MKITGHSSHKATVSGYFCVANGTLLLLKIMRHWQDGGITHPQNQTSVRQSCLLYTSETPAALEEDALRALWQLHRQGAKLQVAEQYWLYPTLAKRLAAVYSGALGTPQFARLSVAHGYHAVSLARLFLNAGQQPVRVTGRSWTEKIIETDSRWGAVHNGALVEKTLQQHTCLLYTSRCV